MQFWVVFSLALTYSHLFSLASELSLSHLNLRNLCFLTFKLRGIIPNEHGRVLQVSGGTSKDFLSGCYVSGWLKRGPSGIIGTKNIASSCINYWNFFYAGTNKFDAAETVDCIISDFVAGKLSAGGAGKLGRDGLTTVLKSKGVQYSNTADWERILELENQRGQASGKSAEKISSLTEKLSHVSKKY